MFANLTGWHALILLAVVLLVFGAAKLPALAKSVGQSVHILKKEIRPADAAGGPTDTVADGAAEGSAGAVSGTAASVVSAPPTAAQG